MWHNRWSCVYTTLEMIPRSFVTPRNECNYLSGCAIKRKIFWFSQKIVTFSKQCCVSLSQDLLLVGRAKCAEKWCKDDFFCRRNGCLTHLIRVRLTNLEVELRVWNDLRNYRKLIVSLLLQSLQRLEWGTFFYRRSYKQASHFKEEIFFSALFLLSVEILLVINAIILL
jgi:hypothetical protein